MEKRSQSENFWDSVDTAVWAVLGASVLYYGDGRNSLPTILLRMDDRINRWYLSIGILLAALNVMIFFYLHFWCGCWMGQKDITPEKVAPWSLHLGMVSMTVSMLCFMVALKDIFGWMVLLVMPILGVAFVTLLDWVPFFRGKCAKISLDTKRE